MSFSQQRNQIYIYYNFTSQTKRIPGIFLRKARFVVLEGKFNLKIKLSWVLDKHFDSKAWK